MKTPNKCSIFVIFLGLISINTARSIPSLKKLCLQKIASLIEQSIDSEESFTAILEKNRSVLTTEPANHDVLEAIRQECAVHFSPLLLLPCYLYNENPPISSLTFNPLKPILSSTSEGTITSYNLIADTIKCFVSESSLMHDGNGSYGRTTPLDGKYSPEGLLYFSTDMGDIGIQRKYLSYFDACLSPISHIVPEAKGFLLFVATHILFRATVTKKAVQIQKRFEADAPITALAYNPIHKLGALGLANGDIVVFKKGFKEPEKFKGHHCEILSLYLTHEYLVSQSRHMIRWWKPQNKEQKKAFFLKPEAGQPNITSCATTLEGTLLAYIQGKILKLWRTDLKREIARIEFNNPLIKVTFNHEGTYGAVADIHGNIYAIRFPSSMNLTEIIFLTLMHTSIIKNPSTRQNLKNLKEMLAEQQPHLSFESWMIETLSDTLQTLSQVRRKEWIKEKGRKLKKAFSRHKDL